MPKFTVEFGTPASSTADGRLDGSAFHRNHEAIWQAIGGFLQTSAGHVLELGSGTGQHAVAFASRVPQLTWWPSDIHQAHLASIDAWRRHAGLANLRAPQRIDLIDPGWTWTGDGPSLALTAIVCINVVHIAPWAIAQNLMAGAGRLLQNGGRLFLYGPFMRDGAHTAPSNAAFDASLRAQNPEWGVRDLRDLSALAKNAGMTLAETVAMPANNLVLAFERPLRHT